MKIISNDKYMYRVIGGSNSGLLGVVNDPTSYPSNDNETVVPDLISTAVSSSTDSPMVKIVDIGGTVSQSPVIYHTDNNDGNTVDSNCTHPVLPNEPIGLFVNTRWMYASQDRPGIGRDIIIGGRNIDLVTSVLLTQGANSYSLIVGTRYGDKGVTATLPTIGTGTWDITVGSAIGNYSVGTIEIKPDIIYDSVYNVVTDYNAIVNDSTYDSGISFKDAFRASKTDSENGLTVKIEGPLGDYYVKANDSLMWGQFGVIDNGYELHNNVHLVFPAGSRLIFDNGVGSSGGFKGIILNSYSSLDGLEIIRNTPTTANNSCNGIVIKGIYTDISNSGTNDTGWNIGITRDPITPTAENTITNGTYSGYERSIGLGTLVESSWTEMMYTKNLTIKNVIGTPGGGDPTVSGAGPICIELGGAEESAIIDITIDGSTRNGWRAGVFINQMIKTHGLLLANIGGSNTGYCEGDGEFITTDINRNISPLGGTGTPVSAATSNTIQVQATLPSLNPAIDNVIYSDCGIYILDGTGAGQYAQIVSYDSLTNPTFTLDRNLDVVPDTTSTIIVQRLAENIVGNNLTHTEVGGVTNVNTKNAGGGIHNWGFTAGMYINGINVETSQCALSSYINTAGSQISVECHLEGTITQTKVGTNSLSIRGAVIINYGVENSDDPARVMQVSNSIKGTVIAQPDQYAVAMSRGTWATGVHCHGILVDVSATVSGTGQVFNIYNTDVTGYYFNSTT